MVVEDYSTFVKRKLTEAEELIRTAKDQPSIMISFAITDTVIRASNLDLIPVKRIQVEINESMLKEIKDKI